MMIAFAMLLFIILVAMWLVAPNPEKLAVAAERPPVLPDTLPAPATA